MKTRLFINILIVFSLCFSCINLSAQQSKEWSFEQWKIWEGDSRSYIVEFYKMLFHNQDVGTLVFPPANTNLIEQIYKHKDCLLQGCNEETILSLVEKAESFTDGLLWGDTIFHIHFPNGNDIYYQVVNAHTFNQIWLPNGCSICFSHIYFYRPAIINDPDGFVNIREKADKNSRIVGKLKERELFYFTPISGSDWYKVYHEEYQPCLGYIHKSRITTFNDFPEDLKEQVRKKGDDCEGGEEEE